MAVIVEVYDQNGDLEDVRVDDGERWELDNGVLDIFSGSISTSTRKRIATFADGRWRSVKLGDPSDA